MNARSMRARLRRVERKILPQDDSSFTLEELCQSMWRRDKRKFLEIAKNTSLTLFARQFEFDALESAAVGPRMRRPK